MHSKRSSAHVVQLPTQGLVEPQQGHDRPHRATLVEVTPDGSLVVSGSEGQTQTCDWLETSVQHGLQLEIGDTLLVQSFGTDSRPVVLGRVGRYAAASSAAPSPHLKLESTETLSLRCGESSIDLRADGKVVIRGDDVLVRAKGTQRIRAGSVSIN